MARVVLVGAFGQRNVGDEALCAAFCAALRDHDVLVASADPGDTTARHGVAAFRPTPRAAVQAVRQADAVVVGGGTVFKRLLPGANRRRLGLLTNTAALVAWAHATGADVALVGVGAGEMHGRLADAISGWIARHADLLVLRDEESAAVLDAASVPAPFWIAADPVWAQLDRRPAPPRRGTGGRRLTVALSHHARVDALADALGALAPAWSIRLQPWQAGGPDLTLARRLREAVPSAVVEEPPANLDEAIARLAESDVVLGLRFHALVAAATAGTPFVAVAHEPKLAAIARRLGQVSVPPNAAAEVLVTSVVDAPARGPATPDAVAAEATAARDAFGLLHLLLGGGAIDEPASLAALPLSSGDGAW